MHSKSNKQLFPKQVVIQLPQLKQQQHIFLPIFYFKLQDSTKRSIMGSCYSGEHIAEDLIHTDVTTCNTEEPQQKNRLGTFSSRLRALITENRLVGLNM